MVAPATADEISDYLLWLSANESPEDPDYLTPLKLQKLLYYVQGWAMAEWGTSAFADDMEAWKEGPVVRQVYQRFKGVGGGPILESPPEQPGLDDATARLVRTVWSRYKKYSAFELSRMTHAEVPWKKARGERAPSAQSRSKIRLADLVTEFSDKIERAKRRLAARQSAIGAIARRNSEQHAPWLLEPGK